MRAAEEKHEDEVTHLVPVYPHPWHEFNRVGRGHLGLPALHLQKRTTAPLAHSYFRCSRAQDETAPRRVRRTIMDIFSRSNRFSRSISMFRSVHRQQTGEHVRSQLHVGRGAIRNGWAARQRGAAAAGGGCGPPSSSCAFLRF